MKKFLRGLGKYLPTGTEIKSTGKEAKNIVLGLRKIAALIVGISGLGLLSSKELGDAELIGIGWRVIVIAVLLALPKMQAKWPRISFKQIATFAALIALAVVHLLNLDLALLKIVPKVGIWPILIGLGLVWWFFSRRNKPTP